jgi:hypothetical protein
MKPIAIDATALSIMLHPAGNIPNDPTTGLPIELARARIMAFVARMEKERRKLIIPTPASAELLTIIGPTSADYIRTINRKAVFDVRAFDEIAATELAFLNRDIFASLDGKNKLVPWQKVKVDRQILAIAKVAQCEHILTEDGPMGNRARLCGIEPMSVCDMPIPDSAKQGDFFLQEHEEIPDGESPMQINEETDGGAE